MFSVKLSHLQDWRYCKQTPFCHTNHMLLIQLVCLRDQQYYTGGLRLRLVALLVRYFIAALSQAEVVTITHLILRSTRMCCP